MKAKMVKPSFPGMGTLHVSAMMARMAFLAEGDVTATAIFCADAWVMPSSTHCTLLPPPEGPLFGVTEIKLRGVDGGSAPAEQGHDTINDHSFRKSASLYD